jgi:hypothetical protein
MSNLDPQLYQAFNKLVDAHNNIVSRQPANQADQNAVEADVGNNATESAKEFPQQLQSTNQAIENETGVPTPTGSQVGDEISRDPSSEVPMQRPDASNPFGSGEQMLQPNLPSDVAQRNAMPNGRVVGDYLPPVPGVSNPTKQNPEELKAASQNVNSVVAQQDQNMNSSQALGEVYAKGEVAKQQGVQDIAQNQMSLNEQGMNRAMNLQAQYADQAFSAADDLKKSINSITAVDPNRLFNDSSTLGKVGFLISAAAGGMNIGGALDNIFKNDIQAQIATNNAMGMKSNNLMSILEKFTGNTLQAAQMANGFYQEYAKNLAGFQQAGIAQDPNVIAQKTLTEFLMPMAQNVAKNKIEAAGIQAKLVEAQTAQTKEQNSSQLEVDKQRMEGFKLKLEAGKVSDTDKNSLEAAGNEAYALNRLADLRRSGFDPSGIFNNGFMREYLSADSKDQVIAKLASSGMKTEDVTKAETYASNVEMLLRQRALEQNIRRQAGDAEDPVKKYMGSFATTPQAISNVAIQQENSVRNAVRKLDNPSILRARMEYPELRRFLISNPNEVK